MNDLSQQILDPSEHLSEDELKEFGTIVTAAPTKPVTLEKDITEIETPVSVRLTLTPEQHSRFIRTCSLKGMNPDEYVQSLVIEDLTANVGKAIISGPSKIGTVKTTGLIKGPSSRRFR